MASSSSTSVSITTIKEFEELEGLKLGRLAVKIGFLTYFLQNTYDYLFLVISIQFFRI